jgi:hypothetical protein
MLLARPPAARAVSYRIYTRWLLQRQACVERSGHVPSTRHFAEWATRFRCTSASIHSSRWPLALLRSFGCGRCPVLRCLFAQRARATTRTRRLRSDRAGPWRIRIFSFVAPHLFPVGGCACHAVRAVMGCIGHRGAAGGLCPAEQRERQGTEIPPRPEAARQSIDQTLISTN